MRTDKDNQDAWKRLNDNERTPKKNVIAIADGHGSPKYFRSERGSKFAVESCVQVFENILVSRSKSPEDLFRELTAEAPKQIVEAWKQRVEEDFKEREFTKDELARAGLDNSTLLSPEVPYGATFLAIALTEEFLFVLQLGDGDILLLNEDNRVSPAVAEDPALIANETYSLCMKEAWKYCRAERIDFRETSRPRLVTLSTDGLSNCFANRADFEALPREIFNEIRGLHRGMDDLSKSMEEHLNDWSQRGSGDDITLAIVQAIEEDDTHTEIRRDVVKNTRRLESHEEKIESAQRRVLFGFAAGCTALILLFAAVLMSGLEHRAVDKQNSGIQQKIADLQNTVKVLSSRIGRMEQETNRPKTPIGPEDVPAKGRKAHR